MRAVPFKPWIEFQVGRAVHAAIEFGLTDWEKGVKKVPAEMLSHFVKELKKEGITEVDQLEYWRLNAQNMLLGWYTWASSHEIRPQVLEWKVKQGMYSGVLDFVGEVDGQRYIIDWKTSQSKYDQKRTDNDGQLTSYVWLDGENYDTKVAHGVLVKGTSTFQFLEAERTKKDVEGFLSKLSYMDEQVKTYHRGDDAPKHPSRWCSRCDLYALELCEGQDDF